MLPFLHWVLNHNLAVGNPHVQAIRDSPIAFGGFSETCTIVGHSVCKSSMHMFCYIHIIYIYNDIRMYVYTIMCKCMFLKVGQPLCEFYRYYYIYVCVRLPE